MHDRQESATAERARKRFDPARAHRLDDPARFAYLAPETVAALVDAPPNATVLDFGAGTGAYALPFAQARPDCTVLALDTAPEMLAFLRAKPGAERVRSGGAELLDAMRGRIARIVAINVLHELEDEHLRALRDAAAPNARLVMIDWNPEVERPGGPANEHLLTPADAARYLTSLRWTVERTELLPHQYAIVARA